MVLRRVDPTGPPGLLVRVCSWLGATRPARFVSRHLFWRLDPFLLRVTRGRVASTLVIPSAVLETRGARTGAVRRHAVIYFHDGDRAVVMASQAGAPRHPAWYHNLLAHPDVVLGGVPMTAAVVREDAERRRLEGLADRVLPAFERYRAEAAAAGREIPVVVLVPR